MSNLPFDPSAPLPHFRRAIDAAMVEHEGESMLMLRDTEGVTEHVMLVSPSALLLISLLDGKNSLSDIKALIMKHTGVALPELSLANLVEEFQKLHFLETEETAKLRAAAEEAFRLSPVRKPVLSGISYPREQIELSRFMGGILKNPDAPQDDITAPFKTPVGLIAPHIDLTRGGACYSWAYQTLAKCEKPDVIVAVGVAHAEPNAPWVFSGKKYLTPCGEMNVDEGLLKSLSDCLWYDRHEEEMVHKSEHSLEYQALWLKYIWRDDAPPWIPVLVSNFEYFSPDKPPESSSAAGAALDKMCGVLSAEAAKGKKIMILAAVDMSHIAAKKPGEESQFEKVEELDKVSLDLAFKLDAGGFYRDITAGGNPRRVCGLSALYTATRFISAISPNAHGRLLNYGVSPDPTGGAVSFAAAIFG